MNSEELKESIAIIGMECRLPGASNLDELWDILANGKETITHFSKNEIDAYEAGLTDFEQARYIRSRGVLSDIDQFDASFFGFSPKEASNLDPQQRIWLEVAWNALERSGYCREHTDRMIGVFTGSLGNNYLLHNLLRTREDIEAFVRLRGAHVFSTLINNNNSFLATRTSYKLKLNGPSVSIQTACSTSLVAVVTAVQSLLNYESDICIAGGVNIIIPQEFGYFFHDGAIGSKDGHCRPFDHRSSGTVFGSGAGAVVLKRWEDAVADGDHILAVIRGAAINNDGARKAGYSAPSIDGQAEVISLAQSFGGVTPESISYIEAHGTGTPIGDPIEVEALKQVFGEKSDGGHYCGIGSIKGNVGHLDVASGIAGLIKVVLAIQNRQLPPTINFQKPNPKIDFENSPFFVVDRLIDWQHPGNPLRAGVSSFGIGGTNAHVVIEAPTQVVAKNAASRNCQLLAMSAKTDQALDRATHNLARYIENNPSDAIADIAYTLQTARYGFDKRRFVVCENSHEAASTAFRSPESNSSLAESGLDFAPKVAFLFPDQQSQYFGMGKELYRTELVFKKAVEQCLLHADKYLDRSLGSVFEDGLTRQRFDALMGHNAFSQLAVFTVEYALAQLWESWGVNPALLLGHSLGEWATACFSGIISIEDAIEAVYHRGRLLQTMTKNRRALTAWCSPHELSPFLNDDLSLAAINGPELCLISGSLYAIKALRLQLYDREIRTKNTPISVELQPAALDSAIGSFHAILNKFDFSPGRIPIISTTTGNWLTNDDVTDSFYWANQMRQPVNFAKAIHTLLKDDTYVCLEVGPGSTLTKLTRHNISSDKGPVTISSLPDNQEDGEQKSILKAAGRLWMTGSSIDWEAFYRNESRKLRPLPTYPFERRRYWVDPPELLKHPSKTGGDTAHGDTAAVFSKPVTEAAGLNAEALNLHPRPELTTAYVEPTSDVERFITKIWREELGISAIGINDNFSELGGDSLIAVQVMERIKEESGKQIPLEALAKAETIAKLAEYFNVEFKFSANWTSLVLLREGTDLARPYLFIPHGVAGNVHWGYINIIRNIDPEQTIYGFSVPKGRRFKSLSEMASHYIKEMKELQPEGPYCLTGYCYGGALAYEIAYHLHSAGDEIAFLGLIEAWPTNTSYGQINLSSLYVYRFLRNIPFFIQDVMRKPLEINKRRFLLKFKRYKRIFLTKIKTITSHDVTEKEPPKPQHILLEEMFDLQELRGRGADQFQLVQNNLLLQRQNYPKPCAVKAEVFRTKRQPLLSPHDPNMGWAELALKGVSSHVIPGSHQFATTEPYARILSELLSARLRAAIGK